VRSRYPDTALADLYDPLAIPGPLVQAHQKLDRAVDRLYVPRGGLSTESERLAILFEHYVALTADGGLFEPT